MRVGELILAGGIALSIIISPAAHARPFGGGRGIGAGVSTEVPGPSVALVASASYNIGGSPFQVYTCTTNYYVSTTGNDSTGNGSPGNPWATVQHADSTSPAAGSCINVAGGTYTFTFEWIVAHGGSSAAAPGYVTYRCTGNIATADNSSPGNTCMFKSSSSGQSLIGDTATPYVVFDGFELNCNGNTGLVGITTYDMGSPGLAHHVWSLNNYIHDCQQSGLELDTSDYMFALHNLIINNSNTGGFQGSGIAFVTEYPITGYSPTSADIQVAGGFSPQIHNLIDWNVSHDNKCTTCVTGTYNGGVLGTGTCTGTAGTHTDGNGIIMDSFYVFAYPYTSEVAFNVSYNNGGGGVHVGSGGTGAVFIIANNTAYDNYQDPCNTGTARGDIDATGSGGEITNSSFYFNNIEWAYGNNTPSNCFVGGYGPLSCNSPTLGGTQSTPGNAWQNNISNNTLGFGSDRVASPDTFPTSGANKNYATPTSPSWAAPNSGNFALSGGSIAIGEGQTPSYLSAQAVDAGACYHTLSTCP